MKILYLSNHDLDSHSGVVTKIRAQVTEWKKQGHEVYVFSTFGLKLFNAEFKVTKSYKKGWRFFRRTSYLKVLVIHIYSYLISMKIKPAIVYSRYFLYSPFLSLIFLKFPTIFEINGDDKSELRKAPLLVKAYNLLTRDFIFLGASGFVFVSNELKLKQQSGKHSVVIPNGISEALKLNPSTLLWDNSKIHVGFSGTANQNWHGVEKLIPFFEKSNDLHLHVIGIEGISTEYVTYYGQVDTKKNLEVLDNCRICISTLALHRKNMEEASPLKSREYVLLGKRFIYAYDDADLDDISSERQDLFLKIPNREFNVAQNWDRIEAFIRTPNNEKTPEEIKLIGQHKLIYSRKEQVRINFFNSFIKDC